MRRRTATRSRCSQSLRAGETRQERDTKEIVAPALELRGLSKTYQVKRRGRIFHSEIDVHAVREVSLVLPRNSIVGLVGESGSGKSTTGMLAMRLVDPTGGQILVNGDDISRLDSASLKSFRRQMQMVFQDSYSALDPMMTLSQIVAEPLHIHGLMTAAPTDAAGARLAREGRARPQLWSALPA